MVRSRLLRPAEIRSLLPIESESILYPDWPGHTLIFGKTGSGKSTLLKALLEIFHIIGFKVIDIDFTTLLEGGFTALDSRGVEWMAEERARRLQDFLVAIMDEDTREKFATMLEGDAKKNFVKAYGPGYFDTEIYVPYTTKLIEDFPDGKIPSIFRPFRICYNDLTSKDMEMVLHDELSGSTQQTFKLIFSKFKGESILDLIHNIQGLRSGKVIYLDEGEPIKLSTAGFDGVLTKLLQLHELGFISPDKNDKLRVDMEEVMKSEKVTVFGLSLFPEDSEELKNLTTMLLLNTIRRARKHRTGEFPELALGMRELHKFAPHQQDEMFHGLGILRRTVLLAFTEWRSLGVRIVADDQRPTAIHTTVFSQTHSVFMCRLDKVDLDNVAEKRDVPDNVGRATKGYKGKGKFTILSDTIGSSFKVPVPRSRCPAVMEDFLTAYRNSSHRWKNLPQIESKAIDMRIGDAPLKEKGKGKKATTRELILRTVKSFPGSERRQIIDVTGLSDSAGYKELAFLLKSGALEERKDGRLYATA